MLLPCCLAYKHLRLPNTLHNIKAPPAPSRQPAISTNSTVLPTYPAFHRILPVLSRSLSVFAKNRNRQPSRQHNTYAFCFERNFVFSIIPLSFPADDFMHTCPVYSALQLSFLKVRMSVPAFQMPHRESTADCKEKYILSLLPILYGTEILPAEPPVLTWRTCRHRILRCLVHTLRA